MQDNGGAGKSPKKSYIGGGSMQRFFKPTPGKQADTKPIKNSGGVVPMLFKQRKANI